LGKCSCSGKECKPNSTYCLYYDVFHIGWNRECKDYEGVDKLNEHTR
jgi:hypothetical protein